MKPVVKENSYKKGLKKDSFPIVDVRKLTKNFLPGFLKKARQVEVGEGICVVQSFDPVPLYPAMESLGFEHVLPTRFPRQNIGFIFIGKK